MEGRKKMEIKKNYKEMILGCTNSHPNYIYWYVVYATWNLIYDISYAVTTTPCRCLTAPFPSDSLLFERIKNFSFRKKEKKKNFEIPQKGRVEGHNVEMYLYYHHYYQQASVYLNAISYSTFMYSITPRCYTPQKRKATFLSFFFFFPSPKLLIFEFLLLWSREK